MTRNDLSALAARLHLPLRHRVPVILQTEAAECGLACLAMVAGSHRLPADLPALRRLSGFSSRGATLRAIMHVAAATGLKSRALRLDMENLKDLKTPCILHWDLNHFVVLVRVRRNTVIIHDPAAGKRVMGMNEVSLHFTGVALELWPSGEAATVSSPEPAVSLWSLTGRISGLGVTLTKLFCFSVLIESAGLLLPVGMQLTMDHVIPAADISLLTLICLGLLLSVLFSTTVSLLRAQTSLMLNTLTDVQWKARLFDRMLSLPLDYFEKRRLGDIQSRFISLDTLRTTLTTNVVSSIIDGLMAVGLLIMLTLYGGWLVLAVLGITLVWCIFRLATYTPYRRVSEEQLVKSARSSSHFMETLYGIATLKALGLSASRSQHWMNLNIDTANATVRRTRYEMLFSGGSTLIGSLGQILILWLGADRVIDGQMTPGMFVAFMTYRTQFAGRAANLLNMLLQLRMLSLHKARVADVALAEPETTATGPVRPLVPAGEPAALSTQGLAFQYDPLSPPLFSHLALDIAAGESVAITGPSGQGKTTLMKILAGLLKPSAGEVQVNGISIAASPENWRASIACVLQDDTLFAGSVAENICASDSQQDTAWMEQCARLCCIHDDILRMPMGYQTLVSELGGSLSGGQKQRLLIARALYRRPAVLFLDEATSHLDEENEARINAAIRELKVTRVMIAHRPSTIASADRVIRLGP
ncbi:peptidase domain-containing ABC transporter [Serratia sp. 1D1416]|uniref:peptidase domain-containing ABC transporter n=1 Tax=Serratia sp. 1D1416 TaxID=2447890 RepID=UPI001013CA65|nr:peptidase domain-containing ABC transporter [Serratia sp. 1D1416]